MNNIHKLLIFLASALLMSACVKDLDTQPIDPDVVTGESVYATADGYTGVLAKCYASFVVPGQGSDNDISNMDSGYSCFTRALYYLQECTTDEVLFHAGGGKGSLSLITMNWDASTELPSYIYYRLYITISLTNEFLRECTDEKLAARGLTSELGSKIVAYRAEARFMRAYCYTMLCDLYGSVPFIDDSSLTGTIPEQKSRKEIYDYVVTELTDIENDLVTPGAQEYGRIDRVADWFLLSRVYLNAEVYSGTADWGNAYKYAKMVIDDNHYSLAPNYIENFLKDNNTCPEIIWGLVNGGDKTQGSGGTNFVMKYSATAELQGKVENGLSENWSGNGRLRTAFVNKFAESDQDFDPEDTWCDKKMDKRALLYGGPATSNQKETWTEGSAFKKDFKLGYSFTKYRNVTKDRSNPGRETYSSVDLPMFRKAEAYLTAAEAILRGGGGSKSEALGYVNEVRNRAYHSGKYAQYGNNVADGAITESQLTLDFILDERARELYTEMVRRTDLIRYDYFTTDKYVWDWKGCATSGSTDHAGKGVNRKYNLFPIPQDDILNNPHLRQNPDFE